MPLSVSAYRPRQPETSVLYRVLEQHFERYAMVHAERFEPRDGPLRSVVRRVVEQYLECGRLQNGFARLRCAACHAEHLLAFSCQTRNFCPSCQAKRAALFAEHVREEIALPVPHRHVTFTIPRALRGLFERDRRLLSILPRCAYEAVRRTYQAHFRRQDAVPGMIASIQTFGSYLNFHPHVHTQITEGVVTDDASFLPLLEPDLDAVSELFRRLVLAALRKADRLSESFHERLLGWSPSGFSAALFGGAASRSRTATSRASSSASAATSRALRLRWARCSSCQVDVCASRRRLTPGPGRRRSCWTRWSSSTG